MWLGLYSIWSIEISFLIVRTMLHQLCPLFLLPNAQKITLDLYVLSKEYEEENRGDE
jgi:hypothetical protein